MNPLKPTKRRIRPPRFASGGMSRAVARPLFVVRLTIGFGIVGAGVAILALHGASLP